MYDVIKRNGKKVKFDKNKIDEAIKKAFNAVNREYEQSIIDLLVLRTCADFETKISNKEINVEDIQDSVEKVLIDANYSDVAKAYILYRKQREKARNIDSTLMDYNKLVNSYVDLNNNDTYSVGGLVMSNSAAITSNYWLSEIYDEQISNAHKNSDIEILDLDMLTGFSISIPLEKIILEGIKGSKDNISSAPAKHLNTLCNQLVNVLSIIQNEWAGPLYIKSFDSLLAPFIKEEGLSYKEIKASIETFIYGINMPTCLGGKTPKINIILDYGKSKEEKLINKAILEILINGDSKRHKFINPKFIYKINKKSKFNNDENDELLLEYVSKYNEIYFLNDEYANIKDGTIGIVSIDISNKDIDTIDKQIDIACRSLMIKKEIITRLFKNGLYPYTSKYINNLNNLSSSIALKGIKDEDIEMINHIKDVLESMNKKYDNNYDLVLLNDSLIDTNDDLFTDLDNKEKILPLFNVGGIYKVYLKDNKPNKKSIGSLIEKIISNYNIPYFVIRKDID